MNALHRLLLVLLMAVPTIKAMDYEQEKIAKQLLAAQELDSRLLTAVVLECLPDEEEMDSTHIEQLLNLGADVNWVDPQTGKTVLARAADAQRYDLVTLFLKRGVIAIKDRQGNMHVDLGDYASLSHEASFLLLMHRGISEKDVADAYARIKSDSVTVKHKLANLDEARLVTYYVDVQARKEFLAKVGVLNKNVEGIVAEYAGCYHHVEDHPLLANKLEGVIDQGNVEKITACIPTADRVNALFYESEQALASDIPNLAHEFTSFEN